MDIIRSLGEQYAIAIAASDFGVPNGHLYAMVAMPMDATLYEHNAALDVLKKAGMVHEEHFLLTWTGNEKLRDDIRKELTKGD